MRLIPSPGTLLRPAARQGATAQNALEVIRFGGFETGEEPRRSSLWTRATTTTVCCTTDVVAGAHSDRDQSNSRTRASEDLLFIVAVGQRVSSGRV
jgi:hypothetical protein